MLKYNSVSIWQAANKSFSKCTSSECLCLLDWFLHVPLSLSLSLLLPLPAILVSLPFPQAPHCARISGCIWVSASHPAQWTANFSRSSERTSTSALYLVSNLQYTGPLYIPCLCIYLSFKPPALCPVAAICPYIKYFIFKPNIKFIFLPCS